ncbi:HD family phosphohydrolase [Clostridium sardiniense]|uniref:HD family phosphohydrolase n=1 Tax=Clostridium sardiniense TaxID=29369 RepID=A0ABS7KZ61_CLOSR|nr:HD family phosphohydrolase [Clostridium sardiniense]MBM7833693.1 putative nucleotidyltransferase with HDIG domain [Clostridium sardiniense]MBY0756104.1 HD family phosphohydrolase [Clostridium sardiniense]MDQ0458953.1 putative nucleotidyltransferase with HDIG domain [Clostridium sardiniense]
MIRRNKIEIKPKEKYVRFLINTITIVITYILLITAIAPKQYDLKEGDIARVDIKAPRDTVNELATQERIKEATEKIDKPYTLKGEIQNEVEKNIDDVLNKIINLNTTVDDEKEKLKELSKLGNSNLSESDYKVLLALSQETLNDIKFEVNGIIKEVYEENIQDGNEQSIKKATDLTERRINEMNASVNVKKVLKKLILPELKPNFFYDKEKTDELIKEVQKNVPKVIIKKNQTIVSEGEPVTAEQIAVLEDLGLLDQSGGTSFLILYAVLALFTIVVFFTQYVYISKNHKEVYKNTKLIILMNIINIFSFILARVIGGLSPFAIPLACAPILISLLVDYKLSLVVCSINVIIIGALVNFNPQIIMLGILNAILGSTGLRKMQQRNDIFYSSISLMIMSALLTFTTGVLLSNNFKEILMFSGLAAVGVVFSAVLAIGVLPFLESSFDVVTTLKLLELSNPNNPLLKKLLMEAPGTYHHSMLVANLAEMAAEEINANPVIARVGAYFHDVGKTKRPFFFGENQIGKENPHNKINPNLSTLIIISHVKDGVELAKEYNLPDVIKDIIEQHHGTTLVKYFYYTMKNNAENPEDVKEEDFRYPGPIPSSKEAGIIMLSDSVEAAVRSISEPTKGKIEEMVNNIIKDKLYSGQLDNCDLTLKDLEKIRKCFLKALYGIYHQRIEYPTEKKIKNS